MPLRPFCQAVSSVFSGPSTATPMSRIRTAAPFLYATTTSFQGAAFSSWSLS
jgi:hypothetical protein